MNLKKHLLDILSSCYNLVFPPENGDFETPVSKEKLIEFYIIMPSILFGSIGLAFLVVWLIVR
jgi:hypothetical protein